MLLVSHVFSYAYSACIALDILLQDKEADRSFKFDVVHLASGRPAASRYKQGKLLVE